MLVGRIVSSASWVGEAVILEELLERCGPWLAGAGPQADIVVSTRIRLARNLAQFPFIRRCTTQDRSAIESMVRDRLVGMDDRQPLVYIDVEHLSPIDRQFLIERQLISRELAEGEGPRGVVMDPAEAFSIMVNEEDHLRIQVMNSGLDLYRTWDQIDQLDDRIEERLIYAYHERLGYLTACPTNVGTGMRVSVMMHLPALSLLGEIEKVFRSLQKMGLAVRGLYGEGSQPRGDFYQISNQITLGRSEQQLIEQVEEVARACIEYERRARQTLIRNNQKDVHDRVSRALGVLCTAQTITSEETMEFLSSVRMGVSLGLIDEVEIRTINKLFLHTQPAHLQKLRGGELGTADRNVERAQYLKEQLGRKLPGTATN